jgi:hypothetical protein
MYRFGDDWDNVALVLFLFDGKRGVATCISECRDLQARKALPALSPSTSTRIGGRGRYIVPDLEI